MASTLQGSTHLLNALDLKPKLQVLKLLAQPLAGQAGQSSPQSGQAPAQSKQLLAAQLAQQQKFQQQQQQLRRAKANIQNYQFTTTTQGLLKKYAQYPASLSFHIFENHYRFNNLQDSNIISKLLPMIKSFLKHVIREEIPAEMSELIKDFSIRSYDGCLILQVYDHRNMVKKPSAVEKSETSEKGSKQPSADGDKNASGSVSASKSSADSNATASEKNDVVTVDPASVKPKTYRTVLKPTQLSLYYDLLYHTDSALTRFTDPLALQMESEILTLTNRKLDLSVPLNPYNCDDYLRPEIEYPKVEYDPKTDDNKLVNSFRPEGHKPQRKLHQDELVLHKSSEYEEIMFLLSNKYKKTEDIDRKLIAVEPSISSTANSLTSSTNGAGSSLELRGTPSKEDVKKKDVATTSSTNPSVTTSGNAPTTGQFMRLRFIEEIRKRKETQKQQESSNITKVNSSSNLTGMNNNINTINSSSNGDDGISNTPNNSGNNLSINANTNTNTVGNNSMSNTSTNMVTNGQNLPVNSIPNNINHNNSFSGASSQGKNVALNSQMRTPVYNSPVSAPNSRYPTQNNGSPNMGNASGNMKRDASGMPVVNNNLAANNNITNNNNMNNNNVAAANLTKAQQQKILSERAQLMRSQQFQQTQQFNQQQQQMQQQQQLNQQQINQQSQQQQHLLQQQQALRQQQLQQQLQQQEQLKRQKVDSVSGGSTPQISNSLPPSNMGTPIMRNGSMMGMAQQQQQPQQQQQQQISQQQIPQQQQQQQQQQQPQQRRAVPQGRTGSGGVQTQAQMQQQQLFQSTLNQQEQQQFRQLQSRMNAFVMMGNTGVAPNGTQLTPEQQQQAMQQAKNIQQLLISKFPVYFQRLRQLQAAQQQRRQQLAQQQQQQQQSGGNHDMNQGTNQGVNQGAGQFSQQMQQLQLQQQQIQRQQQMQQMQQQHNTLNLMGGNNQQGGQFNQQTSGLTQQQQQMMNQQMLQQMANMNQAKKRVYQKKK